jgi:hypothetical protein
LVAAVQGATIVREHEGVYANVLVYKQRCDACGYHTPVNSFAVKMLPYGAFDTQSFTCRPACANYQAVKID